MKSKVKFRLQLRFVLISLAAVVVLLSIIVSFTIARSYRQMTVKADKIIKQITVNPDSVEVSDARYFVVTYNVGNKSFECDLSRCSLITREKAVAYAKEIIADKTDKGYKADFRYIVRRKNDGITITFLSRTVALDSYKNNSVSLVVIALVGTAVAGVMLVAFSGLVVSPLVRSREKQKRFITNAGHQLKTPLTVIKADAQMLECEIGENEWVSDIVAEVERMTDMTNKLVYLAKTEEREDAARSEFSLSAVVSEETERFESISETSGKKLVCEITENLKYKGDEKAIREMTSALLDNAFKYGTNGKEIKLTLTKTGTFVRLSVENFAENITPEIAEKFAERFYRFESNEKTQGFGIGLSLVKAVAEAHGGNVEIQLPQKNLFKITVTLK